MNASCISSTYRFLNKKPGADLLLASIGLFIVVIYSSLAYFSPTVFIWATYEDLFGEWCQFYLFIFASLLAFKQVGFSSYPLFFISLSLACGFVAMEEISWGQRLFDYSSPYLFSQYNLQNETNIHNFLTGPVQSPIKVLVEILLATMLFSYGVIYPWAVYRKISLAYTLKRRILPPPTVGLSLFFTFAAIFELGIIKFNEAEVAEILTGSALICLTLQKHHGKPFKYNELKILIKVLSIILVMASLTTWAVYSNDRLKEEIDNRLFNGKLKFARKYETAGLWSPAIQLYEEIAKSRPNQKDVLSHLSDCYRNAGKLDRYRDIQGKQLEIAMQSTNHWSNSVPGLLSVAASYQRLDKTKLSQHYQMRALDRAIQQVNKFPRNSIAVYWLGKVYAQSGNLRKAIIEYKRALFLEPGSKRYRQAIKMTKQLLVDYHSNPE